MQRGAHESNDHDQNGQTIIEDLDYDDDQGQCVQDTKRPKHVEYYFVIVILSYVIIFRVLFARPLTSFVLIWAFPCDGRGAGGIVVDDNIVAVTFRIGSISEQ